MGRILLLALVVLAAILVWKAFGPGTWKGTGLKNAETPDTPQIKGPDDDESFLWELDKKRFKERKERERREREERGNNEQN